MSSDAPAWRTPNRNAHRACYSYPTPKLHLDPFGDTATHSYPRPDQFTHTNPHPYGR